MARAIPITFAAWHTKRQEYVIDPRDWPYPSVPRAGDRIHFMDGPNFEIQNVDWCFGDDEDPDYVEVVAQVTDAG